MPLNATRIAVAALAALKMEVPVANLGKSDISCTRIIHGLWQTSGGWGKIVPSDAVQSMRSLWLKGYTSFDGADHYGPAEDLMGALRQGMSVADKKKLQTFTKWCPSPGPISTQTVETAINKSLARMKTDSLDLLQFHWWDYGLPGPMMDAMNGLHSQVKAKKIRGLALTNFDTAHVKKFVDAGLPVVSNQVQWSMVDMRPAQRMAPYCASAHVSLLTYGTLCGGLLTDAWLGKPEPRSKADLPTPSQGKYFNMIRQWGGWPLFQELLRTCRTVGDRHGVSIANVAVRWVLDQGPNVHVIVGLRAGITEHADDNARVFGLVLSDTDKGDIRAVLAKSKNLMEAIGDCGDEYRG